MRTPSTLLIPLLGLLALVSTGLGSVRAQTLDYAAFEALFGEPVTASVTGAPQRASQVAATMTIITAAEIRRSGVRDIPALLERVAGVDAQQSTRDHSDVSIRGYNEPFAPRLLVLVDGRQVYADYYGFTPWSTLPIELEAIRQIEVVKGPNSALFGFNAVGGVVNIVTYDPLDDEPVNLLALTGGSQEHRQASLVSTWQPGDSVAIRLSAGHRSNDEFSTPIAPEDAGVRRGNERNALNLALAWQATDTVRLGLEASYSDAEQPVFAPLYRLVYDRYETTSVKASVAADTRLGLLQATAYTNEIKSEAFIEDNTEPGLSPENRVTVAQLQSISKLGNEHTLRLSAEYRRNAVPTTAFEGGKVSYEVLSAGTMWEWRLAPALTLTSAVRLDHWELQRSGEVPVGYPLANEDWDRTESEWSYNGSLVWRVSDHDTLRFLIGRGVQLPNLLSLGGLIIPLPPVGFASGIPDLRPTIVENYELGWDRTIPALGVQLHASIFRGRSRNLLANAGDARPFEGLFGLPANIGDSKSVGIEVGLDGTLGEEWRWGTSYTGKVINDDFDPGMSPEVTLAAFEQTTPQHVFRANLGWAQGPWELDAYLRYQSRADGFERVPGPAPTGQLIPIGDYYSVDGRVAYAFTDRLTLALSGQNLHRAKQRETSAPAVERMLFATINFDFGGRR